MKIRMICHYLYINFIVLGGAILWGWMDPSFIKQFLLMLILIAAVYIGVMIVNFRKQKKTAEVLNKELKKLNAGEEKKDQE
jgi:MFS-type transporter involved in bile tolerance (Atg22 family)